MVALALVVSTLEESLTHTAIEVLRLAIGTLLLTFGLPWRRLVVLSAADFRRQVAYVPAAPVGDKPTKCPSPGPWRRFAHARSKRVSVPSGRFTPGTRDVDVRSLPRPRVLPTLGSRIRSGRTVRNCRILRLGAGSVKGRECNGICGAQTERRDQ
jgi:hypothetical protein